MGDMEQPPTITHLGSTRGAWPVQAFVSEAHALNWVVQDVQDRRLWPVRSLDLGPEMLAQIIPERVALAEAASPYPVGDELEAEARP